MFGDRQFENYDLSTLDLALCLPLLTHLDGFMKTATEVIDQTGCLSSGGKGVGGTGSVL